MFFYKTKHFTEKYKFIMKKYIQNILHVKHAIHEAWCLVNA